MNGRRLISTLRQRLGAICFGIGLGVLCAGGRGGAAEVVFEAVRQIDSDSRGAEILTSGEYQFAWNAGGDAELTVNGVKFLGQAAAATPSGITITHDADLVPAYGRAEGQAYAGDFRTLMDSNALSENALYAPGSFDVTVTGLKVGRKYRMQFLMYDPGPSRSMQILTESAKTKFFNCDQTAGGKTVTASFTATATAQKFMLGGETNADRGVLNAITIFQIR